MRLGPMCLRPALLFPTGSQSPTGSLHSGWCPHAVNPAGSGEGRPGGWLVSGSGAQPQRPIAAAARSTPPACCVSAWLPVGSGAPAKGEAPIFRIPKAASAVPGDSHALCHMSQPLVPCLTTNHLQLF